MTFKQQCVTLRKKGLTISQIMRITSRPKTSVYEHIRHLPLSAARQREIKKAHGLRIREFAIARRGKSVRPYKTFSAWNSETVSLVSHLMFDGEMKRGGCIYSSRSDVLRKRVENCMRQIYDYTPKYWTDKVTGVSRISYFNVTLTNYLRTKADELRKDIAGLSTDLRREFIRAFFNDEGCMDYRPSRNFRRIRGYQKDTNILLLVQRLLRDFGVESRFIAPNEIMITGKENLKKFQGEIDFTEGVRINGNRSNSIWKKSLEKRKLLERAIASYKPIGSNGVHRR